MTKDEMLARMSSCELTGWWALAQIEHEEADPLLQPDPADGVLIVSGRDDDDEDDGQDDASTEG